MDKAIDFKIEVSSLVVRLAGTQEETLDFCKDYLTLDENVDIFVSASCDEHAPLLRKNISLQAAGRASSGI